MEGKTDFEQLIDALAELARGGEHGSAELKITVDRVGGGSIICRAGELATSDGISGPHTAEIVLRRIIEYAAS